MATLTATLTPTIIYNFDEGTHKGVEYIQISHSLPIPWKLCIEDVQCYKMSEWQNLLLAFDGGKDASIGGCNRNSGWDCQASKNKCTLEFNISGSGTGGTLSIELPCAMMRDIFSAIICKLKRVTEKNNARKNVKIQEAARKAAKRAGAQGCADVLIKNGAFKLGAEI